MPCACVGAVVATPPRMGIHCRPPNQGYQSGAQVTDSGVCSKQNVLSSLLPKDQFVLTCSCCFFILPGTGAAVLGQYLLC